MLVSVCIHTPSKWLLIKLVSSQTIKHYSPGLCSLVCLSMWSRNSSQSLRGLATLTRFLSFSRPSHRIKQRLGRLFEKNCQEIRRNYYERTKARGDNLNKLLDCSDLHIEIKKLWQRVRREFFHRWFLCKVQTAWLSLAPTLSSFQN